MLPQRLTAVSFLLGVSLLFAACQPAPAPAVSALNVLAVETFLADLAQNVAGDRVKVEALMPPGVDPHSFELTPGDLTKMADCSVLIVNGAGFETFLQKALDNAGGERLIIEAAAGLSSRTPQAGELLDAEHPEGDPHFWLDPALAVNYVENIRDGLSQADPDGAALYAQNAAAYLVRLKELDQWIVAQVNQIPPTRRLLVTNHESFGYFADRYGFKVVGAIVPSVSSGASPSAQELAALVERIRQTGAPAVFLETGANPQLAEQLARETGIRVVTGLYTHSVSEAGGPAATYIDMLKYNTLAITQALK